MPMHKKGNVVIMITLLLIVLVACCINKLWGKVNYVEINKSERDLGITDQKSFQLSQSSSLDRDLVNIALFGLDRRYTSENGRSDVIMILSIDYKNRKIKLSSIMRDMYVYIENHGMDKINHAYSYGGPQLAIKTLNQNFGTDIKEFVAIDFLSLEKLIDDMGGIPINVETREIPSINRNIDELAEMAGREANHVVEGGLQVLDGQQSVAYSRVRDVGNGDFERTERQREVLSEMFNRVRSAGRESIPSYIVSVLPLVETSLDESTIISLAAGCFKENLTTLEMERFPIDGFWQSGNKSGVYYLKTDLSTVRKQIRDFIFADTRTPPLAGDG